MATAAGGSSGITCWGSAIVEAARRLRVDWVDEEDPYVNPMGSKGMGELGIVGRAAAIANAVHHATGIRVRDLPMTLDKLLRS